MPTNRMLKLTCCSKKKKPGGVTLPALGSGSGMVWQTPVTTQLDACRKHVATILYPTDGDSALKPITLGPDVGVLLGPDTNGTLYMPAAERYIGSFYTRQHLMTLMADDDLLIVSGLYGLLRPVELIQDYDLHLRKSYWFWQSKLSSFIIAYMKGAGYDSVIPLVPEGIYLDVLDLTAVEHAGFHVVKGDDWLQYYGILNQFI